MFGDLRNDLYALTPSDRREAVLAVYDRIVRDRELRKGFVRKFQTFLKSLGLLRGEVDGVWGPMTESALLAWQPQMAGRCTRLDDLLGMPSGTPEEFPGLPYLELADKVAAGIDRDLWLSGQCGGVVSETRALKADAGEASPSPCRRNNLWWGAACLALFLAGVSVGVRLRCRLESGRSE